MHAMHHMEILPSTWTHHSAESWESYKNLGRRFATFKVFYTADTPADYEPPHFNAADAEKDKWYFMTHDLDEVPDKTNFGKLDTGHHW